MIPYIPHGRQWRDSLIQLINPNKTVDVYKNLHKGCWSVRQAGKVVAHLDYISLVDCKMIVGKKGRNRVIKEGVKNVHAFIRGFIWANPLSWSEWELEDVWENKGWQWSEATYNPYIHETFVSCKTNQPIMTSPMVDMDSCEVAGSVLVMTNWVEDDEDYEAAIEEAQEGWGQMPF